MVRNQNSLAASRCRLNQLWPREEVGILPFLCTARVRALTTKREGAGNVSCFALSTLSHAE